MKEDFVHYWTQLGNRSPKRIIFFPYYRTQLEKRSQYIIFTLLNTGGKPIPKEDFFPYYWTQVGKTATKSSQRGFLYTAEHSWKNDPERGFFFLTLNYTASKPIPKEEFFKILLNRRWGEKKNKKNKYRKRISQYWTQTANQSRKRIFFTLLNTDGKSIPEEDFTLLNTDGKSIPEEDFTLLNTDGKSIPEEDFTLLNTDGKWNGDGSLSCTAWHWSN